MAGAGVGLLVLDRPVPKGAVLAAGGLALLGLVDDQAGGLSPKSRLIVQAGAGALAGSHKQASTALIGAVALPGVVNVVNFMDGINGISGSTAAVWGLLTALDPSTSAAGSALASVTAGAGLGFLPHNVRTANMFLGDVGSYLLGGLMGAALMDGLPHVRTTLRVGSPLLPYAVDSTQALWRRSRRREPLFEAHRAHVYQRLVDEFDLSHTTVSAMHAATALAVGLAARSPSPALRIIGSASIVAAYAASPEIFTALRRWRRQS